MPSRREFLISASVGVAGLTAGCGGDLSVPGPTGGFTLDDATLHTTPSAPSRTIAPGIHDLGPMGARGQLYVPAGYRADQAAPLAVLLHGAGGTSNEWLQSPLLPVFDTHGTVVLSPESNDYTWDVLTGGFGPDVRAIDTALKVTFNYCNIDAAHVALGGFSDGASYALSLGEPNGTLFSALIACSPGFVSAPGRRGTPRVFVAHGIQDQVLPIDQTSRLIVPQLRALGYDVTYEEFEGIHAIYLTVVRDALQWMEGA